MISNLADVIASPCTSNVVLMDVTGAVGLSSLMSKLEFEMVPNPAHEIVNIKLLLLNGEQATITIENMLGQEIYSTQTTQQLSQLNVSTFVPGIYFVRVQKGNAYSVKRLIVN